MPQPPPPQNPPLHLKVNGVTLIEVKRVKFQYLPVADLVRGMSPQPIFMQFLEKIDQMIGWRPLWG